MNDEELHQFCVEWQRWTRTRRLLGPPASTPNLLARLQPHEVRVPPDGVMSPELAAFDLAVRALPDSVAKLAFTAFYRQPRPAPIKRIADEMGITTRTFYRHVRRTRIAAYDLAIRLMDAHRATTYGVDDKQANAD